MTTSTAALLDRLNVLRAENDKKPIAKWKASRAKLEEAIAELEPAKATRATSAIGDFCREHGINPKVGRAKLRRHLDRADHADADGNWRVTAKVKELLLGA